MLSNRWTACLMTIECDGTIDNNSIIATGKIIKWAPQKYLYSNRMLKLLKKIYAIYWNFK